ncbi:MAG: GNAT family N-acetyltransferase [Syntrophomonadaceae bacterium]|nr:GNAT family N-acetyltransferase [Syntrophomonadaceae bacterium]
MKFQAIRATVDCVSDMGFIHSKSWQAAYRGIIPDNVVDDFLPEKRAAIFQKVITTNPEEYYLFKVDDIPAGIGSLYKNYEENMDETEGEIYSIYFHPDFWGTLATHKAVEFCLDRLKELGFKRIVIWVLQDNIRARKFYEKHGFTLDGAQQILEIGKPLVEVRYSSFV